MDWLEQELKQALERREPPAGFAERVVRRRPGAMWQRWAAAAAVLVAITGAGYGYRWQQGQEAKRQVMEAVRIAAATTNHVQGVVKEMTR